MIVIITVEDWDSSCTYHGKCVALPPVYPYLRISGVLFETKAVYNADNDSLGVSLTRRVSKSMRDFLNPPAIESVEQTTMVEALLTSFRLKSVEYETEDGKKTVCVCQ